MLWLYANRQKGSSETLMAHEVSNVNFRKFKDMLKENKGEIKEKQRSYT
jgi:hypothetical protein